MIGSERLVKIVKLNPIQFDRFALSHKYRNYYQTSMYGEVMSKFGYEVQYLGIVNNQNKLIGATLIMYKETFMKYKIAYAPRGILINYENPRAIEAVIEKLNLALGKQGFMFLRIDPYIPLTIRDATGNVININNNGKGIIQTLKNIGFNYKGRNLFFETEKPVTFANSRFLMLRNR